ncbi:hypothetical protein Thermus77359_22530 [Thermus oshimai]
MLRQVLSRGHPQLGRQGLEEHGQDAGEGNHEEEGEAETAAGLEAGGLVPGVHVAHGDQEGRAQVVEEGLARPHPLILGIPKKEPTPNPPKGLGGLLLKGLG